MKLTQSALDALVGKNIVTICPHKYVGKNNCAHFVAHVLGLQDGVLCNLKTTKEKDRVAIRVNEIYNSLADTGLWTQKPHIREDQNLLIFVTSAKHIDANDRMNDHPQKHVGIYVGDKVYNYSNGHHRVVRETVEHFFQKCDAAYDGEDITLYYGVVG
jgi:hypothetical protein